MLRILFLRSGIDQWPQICRSLRSYLVLAIIKTCKEISFFDYTRTLVQQVDFNPKLSRISFSHLRMHRHVVHCWFIKFYFNPIFTHISGRGGSAGAKFRIALGLPVGAVINCADNTGKFHFGICKHSRRSISKVQFFILLASIEARVGNF